MKLQEPTTGPSTNAAQLPCATRCLEKYAKIKLKKSMNSRLGRNSPGEIRTLVGGSKARYA